MAEFLLIAVGSLLLFSKKLRRSPRWLFVSASLIVLGGALYRFNVYLIGFNPGKGWHYFPSFGEVMVTVGIVALEILAYKVFVALFPVLPSAAGHGRKAPRQGQGPRRGSAERSRFQRNALSDTGTVQDCNRNPKLISFRRNTCLQESRWIRSPASKDT